MRHPANAGGSVYGKAMLRSSGLPWRSRLPCWLILHAWLGSSVRARSSCSTSHEAERLLLDPAVDRYQRLSNDCSHLRTSGRDRTRRTTPVEDRNDTVSGGRAILRKVTLPSDSRPAAAASSAAEVAAAVDAIVDEYRTRCLWSLPPGYYPRTTGERLHILNAIEKNGDLAAYRRISTLRQWLSRLSSEASSNE
jgi:hypothetical protein